MLLAEYKNKGITIHMHLISKYAEENPNKENDTMTEQVNKINQDEMITLGMAFMGFLMGVSAICGILFLSELFQMMLKMMG